MKSLTQTWERLAPSTPALGSWADPGPLTSGLTPGPLIQQRVGQGLCTSDKFLGDADDAGLGSGDTETSCSTSALC